MEQPTSGTAVLLCDPGWPSFDTSCKWKAHNQWAISKCLKNTWKITSVVAQCSAIAVEKKWSLWLFWDLWLGEAFNFELFHLRCFRNSPGCQLGGSHDLKACNIFNVLLSLLSLILPFQRQTSFRFLTSFWFLISFRAPSAGMLLAARPSPRQQHRYRGTPAPPGWQRLV